MAVLKRYSQQLLKRLHLYGRLKESYLYDAYWKIANPAVVNARDRAIEFYRETLSGFQRGQLIFEVGANKGNGTAVFLKLGAKVVAVDPDESNVRILTERFCRYRLFKKAVSIVGQAVSDRHGTELFWSDKPTGSFNTLNQKWLGMLLDKQDRYRMRRNFSDKKYVPTVTLQELICSYGEPFFIKLDIEGHELNALKGLRMPVPYLAFEVHLPEFSTEGLECIGVLEQLASDGKFNYVIGGRVELAADHWLSATEIRHVLCNCVYRTIHVFWKNKIARSV
jgi:FkbM family methyltransferase